MKKWKVFLVMLCAMLVSIGLFACGKKTKGEDIANITKFEYNNRTVSELSFTDNDTWSAIESALKEKSKLTIRPAAGDNYTLTGSDCEITSTIVYDSAKHCEIGRYVITLTPKANNPKKISKSLDVVIAHAFATSGDREICSYCRATKISSEEDAIIHYGNFHSAGSTFTSVPTTVYGEDGTNGAAYTNKKTNSYIEQFGTVDTVNGETYTIPTLTVGRLEPGMTITVKGTAESAWSQWGLEGDKGYFFPVIGIADRFNNAPVFDGSVTNTNYVSGGTSVFVRGEGWVLYNGIDSSHADSEITRMLSALGTGSTGSGETHNYGSHETAGHESTESLPTHYTQGKIPSVSEWTDWVVYSTGEISQSGAYSAGTEIELSWNYRQDGVIELSYNVNGSKLIAYIKVPDSSVGYYDTMLHGDYVDMHITSYERIETRTPSEFFITVNKDNYYEGQMFNPATVTAQFTYEQTGNEKFPQALSRENFYATTATLTTEQAEEAVKNGTDTDWVSLATNPVLTTYNTYIVKVNKGGESWIKTFTKDDIVVVANVLEFATGANVGDFKNNNTVGDFAISTNGTSVTLTPIGDVYAQAIPDGKSIGSATGPDGEYRYVALKLYALAGKSLGSSIETSVPYLYNAEDGTLVLALTKSTTTVEINGLNGTTKTVFDFSAIKGFKVVADVQQNTSGNGWALNNDMNEVTLTFKVTEGTLNYVSVAGFRLYPDDLEELDDEISRPNFGLYMRKSDIQYSNGTLTFVAYFSAADLSNYAPRTIAAVVDNVTEFEYKLDYVAKFADNDTMDSGYYSYVSNNRIYLAKVVNGNEDALTINVNAGNDNVALLNLAYTTGNGKVAFKDASLTGASIDLLTIGGEKIVLIEVNPAAYNISTTAFGYQLKTAQGFSTSYYAVAGNTVEKKTVENADVIILSEGSCLEHGLAGEIITTTVGADETVVKFVTNLTEFGGSHKFAKKLAAPGGVCVLCGEEVVRADFGTVGTVTLHDNEFVELAGDFQNYGFTEVYNGVTLRLTIGDTWYWIRNDGYVGYNDYGVAADNENFWTSFGDDLAQRTPNGKLDANGEEISETTYKETMKAGAVLRVWAGYQDGTFTTIWSMYKKGDAAQVEGYGKVYFAFTHKVSNITENAITLQFGLDNARIGGNTTKNTTWWFKGPGNIEKSMIESAEGSDEATLTVGNIEDHYVTITSLGGNASAISGDKADEINEAFGLKGDEGYTKYYAVVMTLKENYTTGLAVGTVYDAEGNLVKPTVVTFDDNTITFRVAFKDGDTPGVYYVKLANSTGSTLQCNIKLDLTAVSMSDTTAVVTNNASIVTGGTIEIAYSNLPADMTGAKVSLNGEEKALAASMEFADGTKATWVDNKLTLTIAKAANLTGIPQYTIALLGAAGNTINTNVVQLTALPVAGDNVASIDENTFVLAEGNKMYIYLFNAAATGKDYLVFNANNASTNKELILPYSLAYSISGGAVILKTASGLAPTANHYDNGTLKVTQFVIDLSYLKIAEDAAYFFELLTAPIDESTTYYTVASTRALNSVTTSSFGTKKDIVPVSCDTDGTTGYAIGDESNPDGYFGIEVVKHGHLFPADGGLCTRCNDITGWTTDVEVGTDGTTGGTWTGWTFEHGAGKAWKPEDPSARFSSILPGQKVVAEGILKTNPSMTNNWNGIAAMMFPGTTFVDGTHLRIDTWINGSSDQATLNQYNLSFVKNSSNNYDDMKAMRTNSYLTITWDWTNTEEIVVKIQVDGIDTPGTFWCSYTFKALSGFTLASQYSLGIAPDEGYFKGTVTATADKNVVPADKCNPIKHIHGNWNEQDRCPEDGSLNPAHQHVYDQAEGNLCKCGELNPEHSNHVYTENYVCQYCGLVNVAAIAAFATTEKTEITGNFGAANWWNGGTTYLTLSGDFIIKFTFDQGTVAADPTAVFEMKNPSEEDYFDYNPNDGNLWGNLTTATGVVNKTYYNGTKPASFAGASYEVYGYRMGSTFVMSYQVKQAGSVVWSITVVSTGFTTIDLNVHMNGYTEGMTNITCHTGTMTSGEAAE